MGNRCKFCDDALFLEWEARQSVCVDCQSERYALSPDEKDDISSVCQHILMKSRLTREQVLAWRAKHEPKEDL